MHITASFRLRCLAIPALCTVAVMTTACGGGTQIADTGTHNDTARHDTIPQMPAPFHADNDIAMIVGSMADALAVGEPFTAEAYNFTGVLTDGGGAPLYVDKARNPGEWTVRVESPTRAVISNSHDGDLIAADIVDYLTSCLRISSQPVEATTSRRTGDMVVFALHKGYLTFSAPAPDAMQGCRITVALTDSI